MDARINTNELLEAIEEGIVDKDYALMACLKFMSESDVLEMMRANEITCNECGKIDCRNSGSHFSKAGGAGWRECLVNAAYGGAK